MILVRLGRSGRGGTTKHILRICDIIKQFKCYTLQTQDTYNLSLAENEARSWPLLWDQRIHSKSRPARVEKWKQNFWEIPFLQMNFTISMLKLNFVKQKLTAKFTFEYLVNLSLRSRCSNEPMIFTLTHSFTTLTIHTLVFFRYGILYIIVRMTKNHWLSAKLLNISNEGLGYSFHINYIFKLKITKTLAKC